MVLILRLNQYVVPVLNIISTCCVLLAIKVCKKNPDKMTEIPIKNY